MPIIAVIILLFLFWPLIAVFCCLAVWWKGMEFMVAPFHILKPLRGNPDDPAPSVEARKARWTYFEELNEARRNPDQDGYVVVKPIPKIADYWPKGKTSCTGTVRYEQGEDPAVLGPLLIWAACMAFGIWAANCFPGWLS